jgi:hypothetical protein
MLSNDSGLQRQGAASKINYEANFNVYLHYLICSWSENKQSVKCVFRIWNEYFFPSVTGPTATLAPAPAQAIDDAFAALEDDIPENPALLARQPTNGDTVPTNGDTAPTDRQAATIPHDTPTGMQVAVAAGPASSPEGLTLTSARATCSTVKGAVSSSAPMQGNTDTQTQTCTRTTTATVEHNNDPLTANSGRKKGKGKARARAG